MKIAAQSGQALNQAIRSYGYFASHCLYKLVFPLRHDGAGDKLKQRCRAWAAGVHSVINWKHGDLF